MAYIGLARPVIAAYSRQDGTTFYSGGIRFGKAVRIEISPTYEDVSDYGDINDTEEEQESTGAHVTLGISEIPQEAENVVFGHTVSGDEVRSNVSDRASPIGLGVRTREIVSGNVRYVAIWLHKVQLTEEGQDNETKGDSITYATPSVTGRALPDEAGDWRTKKIFETKEAADDWLDQVAGIQ